MPGLFDDVPELDFSKVDLNDLSLIQKEKVAFAKLLIGYHLKRLQAAKGMATAVEWAGMKLDLANASYQWLADDERRLLGERQQKESERRHEREMRVQEALLSVSQGTLSVYRWLKWLTVVLAV